MSVPTRDAPIGMVDSGVGGLTVARAVLDQLPHESLHYVGDTAHSPYGPKPIAEVRAHALAVMDDLVATGVKALVIACNSASSACLRDARERYDLPVVEVILPAVRRAVAATRNGRVGVIGTSVTITSGVYQDAFAAASGVEVVTAACPRFAEFVERGVTSGRQLLGLAESYLAPLNAEGVDTLVLGCTHYPLLTGMLSVVMGDSVTLVSSAEETAKELFRTLLARDLLRDDDASPASHMFRATGPGEPFRRLAGRFMGPEIHAAPSVATDAADLRRSTVTHSAADAMKVTVLGCSGSVPGPDSPASGYLIEAEGYRMVIDLGHGTFGALQCYVDPADVDAIVISHLHADHCIDLTAYVVALRYGGDGYGLRGPEGRIPLIGVPGTRDRLEAAYDPLARKLGLHELFAFATPSEGELGPFRMSYAPMAHPTPTNAIRVEWNDRSLVYSADTGACSALVELADSADVLLCEASVGPDEVVVPDLHMSGRQAGEHAAKAGVDRLLVTHVPPWNSPLVAAEEAAAAFGGPVEVVAAGAEYWI